MASPVSYKWHKVAERLQELHFTTKGIALAQVNAIQLCIVKQGHSMYACNRMCPHAGGDLGEGYVDDAGNIVCPLHFYKFNLTTGRDNSGDNFLRTYPVEIRDDGVWVGVKIDLKS